MFPSLFQAADAAVQHNIELWKVLFQPVDKVATKRRAFPVLFRREAFQPRFAGMDDQSAASGLFQPFGQCGQIVIAVGIRRHFLQGDSCFQADRHAAVFLHGGQAFNDKSRVAAQSGSEASGGNPFGRASGVQVQAVIIKSCGHAARPSQLFGIRAAQLENKRFFIGIKSKQAFRITENGRRSGDHFSIQNRPAGQTAYEITEMPVRPFHHRRDGQAFGKDGHESAPSDSSKRSLNAS